MVELVTVARPGHPDQTIPAVEVDGVEWVYTGEPTQEKMEEFVDEVRKSASREKLAGDAANLAAHLHKLDRRQEEALDAWLWYLADQLQDGQEFTPSTQAAIDNAINTVAGLLATNQPLMDLLVCQLLEKWAREFADRGPVVGGPTHRAVLEVRAGLEKLTGE